MNSCSDTPVNSKAGSKFFKPLLLAFAGAVIASTALSGVALGDTLELKTGQIVQGRFVGGSPLDIRFEVDGKEQIFATKDVLNLGFSDSGASSNAPAPPVTTTPATETESPPSQAPAPPATAPPPDATQSPTAPATNSVTQQGASQITQQGGQPLQAVTIPSGTSLLIRMIDGVDSATNRVSDPFHASLETPLVVGNTVVAQKGADVYGMLARAKEAGKISGSSQLTLELTGIRINGNIVPIDSTTYDVAGKNRGTQSAERIGGGAVAGAVIGGIIGGGRGAAVGATLGAGGGTAVQVMTHGEQVRVPSETLLEFTLEHDVTALVSSPSN
ncbi:MAG TPA: hypothetical protein VNV41_09300 [Candidatus Acidoferrales bacterium]|nr:hypothetical protein [Candidatus Acidoferrales bacterium]